MKLYWREDQNQWMEFRDRGTSRVGPIGPDGTVFPLSDWQQYRQTGFQEASGGYAIWRNRRIPDWLIRMSTETPIDGDEWEPAPAHNQYVTSDRKNH